MININEAAKNYAFRWSDDDEEVRLSIELAYKAGATWKAKQFPLISIDDNMPENYPNLLVKGEVHPHTHMVLAFSCNDFLGLTNRVYNKTTGTWEWDHKNPNEILFWMPLRIHQL